jgi:hypothetical protein
MGKPARAADRKAGTRTDAKEGNDMQTGVGSSAASIRMSNRDFHSAAYWLAGRVIFNLNRGRQISDLSISDPVDTLNSARAEIASAVAAYIHEPLSSSRRGELALALQSLMAGAEAVRRGAARNPDWSGAFGPMNAAAISFLSRQSIALIRDKWPDVQRLGRTLASEKTMTAAMVGFLVNMKPQDRAA